MTTDIIDMKLSWLLSVAERVKSIFASSAESDDITKIIKSTAEENNALLAHNMTASEGSRFMILSEDPYQLFLDIIKNIKATNNPLYQEELNPSNILMMLVDSEYRFDVGGIRLCYGVKCSIPSNYLMKAIACRNIASANSYNSNIDQESFTLLKDKLHELNPLFDYRTNTNRVIGGKKRTFTRQQRHNGRERTDIIARLIEYVRSNKNVSEGIIFIDELSDCSSSAINILYTAYKYKDAITDYLKLLVADKYHDYTFKAFLHSDFSVPYDYRLKKYSCLINQKSSQRPTYIANLYNTTTYDVIPCTRSIINNTFINITHPVIKLWILYIDMYMIERKMGETHPTNHEALYLNKMTKAFNDVQTFDKYPRWMGVYLDERYEKQQFNQKMKATKPADVLYI